MAAIPQEVRAALKPTLLKSGEELKATMQHLAERSRDTGALIDSITVTGPGETTPPYSQPGGSQVVPENAVAVTVGNTDVRYPAWAEDGHIIPTGGNVVDFKAVEEHIAELCARFFVQEIAFDPHMGRVMMANLMERGLPVVEMRQGWVTMAPAIKELERAIVGHRFRHGGHPVLRWNFENIAIHTDSAGNRMFHKGKSRDRIDGAVACAMAVARCAEGNSNRSSYDDAPDDVADWAYI